MPGTQSLALALALLAATAAAQPGPPPTAYARHTNPVLARFGSDAAFLAYIEQARAAAHARGRWWYAAVPTAAGEDAAEADEEERPQEDAVEPGLEVIPGSHGDYDVEEVMLPDGAQLSYSRLDLTMIRPGVGIVWPGIRRRGRVRVGDEIGSDAASWRAARRHPLYRLADIYRPVRDTLESTVHAITICPPRALRRIEPRRCRTTAFVGPRGGELRVSGSHAFVWTVPEYGDLEAIRGDPACAARAAALEATGLPSQIYRLPLASGPLEVIGTRGAPAWGSGFHLSGGHLRALAAWPRLFCSARTGDEDDLPPARLTLVDAPLALFGPRLAELPSARVARVPTTGRAAIRILFVGGWLLYGDLAYEFEVPTPGERPRSGRLFAVPLARPSEARSIDLPHNLVSIGQAGQRAFLTGYRDDGGLNVSLLALGDSPHILSAARLAGRRQSAGSAQIIPTRTMPDGTVIIAIPTVAVRAPIARCASDTRDELAVEPAGTIRAVATTAPSVAGNRAGPAACTEALPEEYWED